MTASTTMLTLDGHAPQGLRFRIDSFDVPADSRAEFDAAAARNLAFIETLPGFRGHQVFERVNGPPGAQVFNVVTVAAWESEAAIDAAGLRVRAHYAEIGFDMPAMLARWNVKAALGNYRPATL